jgi:hypothetical protein
MKTKLNQFKICSVITTLSALFVTAKAQDLYVPGTATVAGGPTSRDIKLLINNDGVGTLNVTAFSTLGGVTNLYAATSGQLGLGAATSYGLAGAYLHSIGAGVVYVDSNTAELANESTSQGFFVNSTGGMDMVDDTATGLHLDGSGHLINDNSFSSDASAFYSDGSGNVTTYGLGTTIANTLPATSFPIPYSPATAPFAWTNTTVGNAVVYIDGLQGSVNYNGGVLFRHVNASPVTVMLQPGAYVSVVNNLSTNVVFSWHPF